VSLFRFPRAVLFLTCLLFASACGHKAKVRPPAPSSGGTSVPAQPPARTTPSATDRPATPAGIPKGAEAATIPAASLPVPDVRGPVVRVKLTIVPADQIRISSAAEIIAAEKTPEALRKNVVGPLQIRAERPQANGPEIFRVQVASLAVKAAAESLAKDLSNRLSQPALLREFPSRGLTQVYMGKFATRSEAQDFASGPIAEAGYRDAFVVQDTGDPVRGEPALAVRGPNDFFLISRSGYLFRPAADTSMLQLNGKPYRGLLDISLGKDGTIVVINQLAMEEYLFGVIPAELNPVSYPEAAALQAQAIAARTYALKRMAGSRAEAFDLTDDTSTQVYGGAAVEKQASSDAVRKTAGMAIYYNGALIDAMYMSTCGGRTEDFSEVFDAPPQPYLKSVFCTVENSPAGGQGSNLAGNHDLAQVLFADDGTPANRELELAQVLGLTVINRSNPDALTGVPAVEEVRRWLERGRVLAGIGEKEAAGREPPVTRAGFFAYAAERMFGARELERSISESDATYYLGNFSDGARVPASARRALAYLVQHKLWQPYPDNSIKPEQPVRRCDALTALVRWILSLRPEILKTGLAADPNAASGDTAGNALVIKRGNRAERLLLAQDFRLFKAAAGRSLPVDMLRIIGNEKLTYHLAAGGEIDFLEVELSATGAASDRFSPVASWQKTIPRSVASEKLRSLAPNVGEIRDLKAARLGASGRVVQLEIIGSRGSAVVNGYQARNRLGLNDTLYTLTRAQAEDGSIASFTFDGRGWGHGVGLCQTGAVGMARAGRTAEEILKTYYQGVELRRAY
jgi:stage II sporulation protein D